MKDNMKKLFILLVLFLIPAVVGGASFSDDFNRDNSDNLGSNWTVPTGAGAYHILNQQAEPQIDHIDDDAIYNTACFGVDQYALFQITIFGDIAYYDYEGVIFRYPDPAIENSITQPCPFYIVNYNHKSQEFIWTRYSYIGGTQGYGQRDLNWSTTLTVTNGDYFGITIVGIGINTAVRIWHFTSPPTNKFPSSDGSLWDGAGPNVISSTSGQPVFYYDSGIDYVDTGNYIGLTSYYQYGTTPLFDNFYGGDISTGSSTTTTASTTTTSIARSLAVTAPNGGESWNRNSKRSIRWNASAYTGTLKLTLWQNGGLIGTIADGVNPAAGSYSWTVGNYIGSTAPLGTGYSIKIEDNGSTLEDSSDAPFSIVKISVKAPNGGESWQISATQNITWVAKSISGQLRIVLFKNGVKVGNIVNSIDPALGTYAWTVGNYVGGTATAGTGYQVQVREIGTDAGDRSDTEFTLTAP
jgi:hypothetical protein